MTRLDHLVQFFGVHRPEDAPPAEFDGEIWPLRLAPFIRLDELGRRRMESGQFGLLPHFAKELKYGRRTYNARSETVAALPSFRTAWKRGQRCIIPAEQIYEPCWESGKAVRWAIEQPDGRPLGIAGVWADHPTLRRANGDPVLSFAMLTVNADGHPVFQRMHGPADEKRMVVIVDPEQYDDWLTCSADEATQYFRQWRGPLKAFPKPLPPRTKKNRGEDGLAPVVD